MKRFLLWLFVWCVVSLGLLLLGRSAHATDLGQWTPSTHKLEWTEIGENAQGKWYVATTMSPLGFVISVKQLRYGLTGKVTELFIADYGATCGPKGEPPDEARAIGFITVDPMTLDYTSQYRSPDIYGTPIRVVPGTVLARAVTVGCYGTKEHRR